MDRTNRRPIIFLGGSIAIRQLHPDFEARLDTIVSRGFDMVVGDASGADLLIQRFLTGRRVARVTVFFTGNRPRHNVGDWPVRAISSDARPGSRAFHTAKDRAMAQIADYGLMAWNGRSAGTLGNVVALTDRKRPCVVFIASEARFVTITDRFLIAEIVSDLGVPPGR